MKRKLIITIALLLGLSTAHPQHSLAQGFELGVRDGIGLSWLVGIDNTLPQAGFYVGFVGNYFFDERLGVGVDVTLSEQGALCRKNSDGVTMDYSFNYLNIPILGQYHIDLTNDHSLRFMAGVQLGVFLWGTFEYTAPSITGTGVVNGIEQLNRNSFHPVDLGITAGAQWLVGKTTAIDVRYTLGITQTHNGISNTLNGYYYISVPDNRNSVLQIGTTILF